MFLVSCGNTKSSDNISRDTQKDTQSKKVLVFTKTVGWRHKSIETGAQTFKDFGKTHNLKVTHTEDSLHFVRKSLAQYDAVVFLNTTGNILDTNGQKAFEKYIQNGGSFLEVHSAVDIEYDWPWYGKLVGGYFESHPNNPNLRSAIVQKAQPHPTTKHYDANFTTQDEWYNFKGINPEVHTVLTLDESSYEGGTNGDFHPIAWYHHYNGGKGYYIGGGHDKKKYSEPDFKQELQQALFWCLE